MTREEAIQELQNCKGLIQQDGQDYLDERDIPLLDMAIEALSERNIARDIATILENEQDMRVILQNAERPTDEWCSDCKEYDHEKHCCPRFNRVIRTTLNEAVANLKEEFESADAVQGWIPVEEQPPQFPCLICDANGNQPSVPLGIVTITDEEHGEWHIDGRLWDTKVFFKGEWCSQTGYGNRIIAWMPLPKPYECGARMENTK